MGLFFTGEKRLVLLARPVCSHVFFMFLFWMVGSVDMILFKVLVENNKRLAT